MELGKHQSIHHIYLFQIPPSQILNSKNAKMKRENIGQNEERPKLGICQNGEKRARPLITNHHSHHHHQSPGYLG
jgi:hypothetical protein